MLSECSTMLSLYSCFINSVSIPVQCTQNNSEFELRRSNNGREKLVRTSGSETKSLSQYECNWKHFFNFNFDTVGGILTHYTVFGDPRTVETSAMQAHTRALSRMRYIESFVIISRSIANEQNSIMSRRVLSNRGYPFPSTCIILRVNDVGTFCVHSNAVTVPKYTNLNSMWNNVVTWINTAHVKTKCCKYLI
jgi:hypothetical protein